jgi:transcriptional regulator with XRE-family HTH domain
MSIGPRVRERRKAQRFSQEQLASQAGLTWSAIQRLEAEQVTDPHYSTLSSIALVLGTTVAELVGEEPAVGKVSAPPDTGQPPYEVGEVVASIPYAEGGQAEAFEEAVLAAREARPHMPDHAHLALIDNGERVEVTIEVPADADLSVGTRRIRRRMRRRV